MEVKTILRDRATAILVDLEKAEDALKVYKPGARTARTWGALRNELEGSRKKLYLLLDAIDQGVDRESVWRQLTNLGSAARSTSQEILAVLQGGALRDAEEDGGIYAIADGLVQEVANAIGEEWAGLTIPGERDVIATRSAIIRLTFPEVSIWDLPVTLHEYGHYVAPRILNELGQIPFNLLCEGAGSAAERAHITELFADLFASYTAGPAFACNLVLLRLDPAARGATKDNSTHPSFDRRVKLALRVLADRSGEIDDPKWTSLVDELGAAWQRSREDATPPDDEESSAKLDKKFADPGAVAQPDDDRLFKRLYGIAERVPNGRYRGWRKARLLVQSMAPAPTRGRPRAPAELDEGTTIRDVLNAAWLARVEQPNASFDIEERARLNCRAILEKTQDRQGGRQLD